MSPGLQAAVEAPAPIPVFEIAPRQGWTSLRLGELWSYRELVYFLVWRDIKVRYKQTALGVAWAVLQPVVTMLLFSIFFGRLAHMPSDGIPYPLFVMAALVPWQLFSFTLTEAGNSLVANQRLITKVYFPRLAIPIAAVMAAVLDFCIAFVVLLAMMVYYRVPVTPRAFAVFAVVPLCVSASLAVGLWLSALNVKYRDVRYAMPFLVQAWLLITPIAYPSSVVPLQWRALYALNPMVGVIETFRWALLGTLPVPARVLMSTSLAVTLLLLGGLVFFRSAEKSFADIL